MMPLIQKAKDVCGSSAPGGLKLNGGSEAHTGNTDTHATGQAVDIAANNKSEEAAFESCVQNHKSDIGWGYFNPEGNHAHITL